MEIKSINPEELSNVMRQYYDIKIEYENEIVLFQLGDFYEMFFEDALLISKQLELTLTSKKAGLKERIPMCGIPLNSLDDYLKKMLSFSHTVVIVDQVQDESLGQKLVTRKIKNIVSEGTYIRDDNSNNYFGSVSKDMNIYYLSYGDIATGELYTLKSQNFSDIKTEIINQNIKELVVDKTIELKYLDFFKQNGVYIREVVKGDIDNVNIKTSNSAEVNLINYFNYTQVNKIDQFKEFENLKSQIYMHMSSNAQKQLEILITSEEGEYKNSLYWYLNNNTITAMGKRLLKKYLVHPLLEKTEIVKRQDIVGSYIKDPILLDETQDLLKQVYDFERLIGKVISSSITPREVEKIKVSLGVLPEIYAKMPMEIFNLENLNIDRKLLNLDELYSYLSKSIITDAPMIVKDGGFIKKGFNKEIDELRKLKENSNKWLIDFENEEIEKTGIKNLKVKYNKIFGYFIEVTNSNINLVPDYYIEKQTMANCKRYITEKLKEEEHKILNAHDMLLNLELKLFGEIKEKIKDNIFELQKTALVVSTIDVLSSFAVNAINNYLVKPELTLEDELLIEEGRHPIVENTVNNYIKNDLELTDQNVLLITGPNMAGKSTYMRMISLIVIMAQIGSYVPAKSAKLKVISSIFTRIGSGDNLSKGKSTFMVEMLETSEAIDKADENSLLIFDELGRGTSTYDGIALAQSIINYICNNIKCKTLFSTHYHELVDMASTNDDIKLVHVKALEEDNELKFYHKVMPGSVSKSYGIEVASLAGLNDEIIAEAKKNYVLVSSKVPVDDRQKIELELSKLDNEYKNKEKDKYDKLLNLIDSIDVGNLTPIESLNEVAKIKDEYDKLKK